MRGQNAMCDAVSAFRKKLIYKIRGRSGHAPAVEAVRLVRVRC
jgi:hypothetical protein